MSSPLNDASAGIARSRFYQNVSPFVIGGCSGMFAAVCVQPLDMIKVRLQLSSNSLTAQGTKPSSITVIRDLLADGRILNFYNGLSAALARQIVYGTGRLGLFVTFEDALKHRAERNQSEYRFIHRMVAAISAGGLASAIGTPTEVALIRMQADGTLPAHQRRNFKSVFDALFRIAKEEGVRGLWGGCLPTVIRAMSTNFGQLAFFSESKHQLSVHTNLSDRARSLVASGIGGFTAAFFSMPFDTVKSRLQSTNVKKYRGMVDCFTKIAREEGLTRFYRGFPAYFSRMAPHS